MKLVVGLGNVGERYENTRHNVGFMLVDALPLEGPFSENRKYLCKLARIKDSGTIAVKPTTLMNASGKSVKKLLGYFKIFPRDLYVVHDDLDLRLGEYKIQFGRGPKVHNGVNSIEESLDTPEFWRVRVGVDNRDLANRVPGETYVLENFNRFEILILSRVLSQISGELLVRLKNE